MVSTPEVGEMVEVRSHRGLVEEVVAAAIQGQSSLVRLASANPNTSDKVRAHRIEPVGLVYLWPETN